MRVFGATAAGLMRRNENLRALQCREPDIFDQVAVVANQHTDAKAVWEVKHGELRPAANRPMLERMQLAMPLCAAIGQRHQVAVVKFSSRPRLHKPGANG